MSKSAERGLPPWGNAARSLCMGRSQPGADVKLQECRRCPDRPDVGSTIVPSKGSYRLRIYCRGRATASILDI